MKALILIASLLPVNASAQTMTGSVGAIGEGVPVPLAGVADPQAETIAQSMLMTYASMPDEMLPLAISELSGQMAFTSRPERRAAARAVLWAVSRDVEHYVNGVSVGIQHALIDASR